ncbi:MAG TPA: hypothetical protein ENJ93_09660 [Chloroflexi bacterium]|nr:hypothetical protein [Chloroflexota bacterium]
MQVKKMDEGGRIIGAALVVAGGILAATAVHRFGPDSVLTVWLTAAVFLLAPLLAALLVRPLLDDWWLYVTAVLLGLSIIIPAAFLHPAYWAAEQLPQLGRWANVLFFVLLIVAAKTGRPSKAVSWLLTGFYVVIMWLLAFLT